MQILKETTYRQRETYFMQRKSQCEGLNKGAFLYSRH